LAGSLAGGAAGGVAARAAAGAAARAAPGLLTLGGSHAGAGAGTWGTVVAAPAIGAAAIGVYGSESAQNALANTGWGIFRHGHSTMRGLGTFTATAAGGDTIASTQARTLAIQRQRANDRNALLSIGTSAAFIEQQHERDLGVRRPFEDRMRDLGRQQAGF